MAYRLYIPMVVRVVSGRYIRTGPEPGVAGSWLSQAIRPSQTSCANRRRCLTILERFSSCFGEIAQEKRVAPASVEI